MIIVKEKGAESVVYVPKHWETTSALTFTLKSRLTNEEFTYTVEDLSGLTDYFVVSADTESLSDGEYEYAMIDNGAENAKVSTGLLIIGEYLRDNEEYNYTQEYLEYNG